MSYRALGIYREPEFSPGKVEADAAILDATLVGAEARRRRDPGDGCGQLRDGRAGPRRSRAADVPGCRARSSGWPKSSRRERSRSTPRSRFATATAICSRRGWSGPACRRRRARWWRPTSRSMRASWPGLDLSAGVFVKRGDLHALAPEDVQRAADRAEVESILADFARRGIRFAYLQQEVVGRVVKFYGVSGGSLFQRSSRGRGSRRSRGARAVGSGCRPRPRALGLEAWGGDAVLSGDRFAIIDFNDWPSYSRVRATCRSRDRAPCDKSAWPPALDAAGNSNKESDRYQLMTNHQRKTSLNQDRGSRPQIEGDLRPRTKVYRARPPANFVARRHRVRSRRRRDADRRRRQHLRRFFCRRRGREPRPCASRNGASAVEAGVAADRRHLRDQGARGGVQAAGRSRARGTDSRTSI